jgi:hypothetical protein
MTNSQTTFHQRFEADLAELAAGVLDRHEEATLLNHLALCPSCAAKFEQLASAASSLLLLVLETEPPVGFETRFLERIVSDSSDAGLDEAVASHQLNLGDQFGCDQPPADDRDSAK